MGRRSMFRIMPGVFPAVVGAGIAAVIGMNSLRAETLDRIAVTVGRQVIAESAILLDLRVSAFLDAKPVDLSPAAKRRSAARLVDQILILQEAADSHVTLSVDEDVDKTLGQVKAQFGSADAYQAALARYGITEKEVSAQLADGIRTLRFSDFRFRPEVQVSDQELRAYYDQLATGWRQKNPELVPTFENSRDQVQQLLIEQRLTDALDKWLAMTRNETRIVYREQVIP
jgi:hypothetical protein